MLIPYSQIKNCLIAAHSARDLFPLHTRQNGDFDTSIDDFRTFMQTYSKVEVLNHRIPYNGEPIRGATIAYDDHYDIILLAGQEPYWKRFVEFKEHFHVILDKSDQECIFRNCNFVEQVEKTFAAFPDMENKSEPHVTCEKLAEIAAMEFLMPYTRRAIMIDSISRGDQTLEVLADLYKIPQEIIDLYLSKSYIDNLMLIR